MELDKLCYKCPQIDMLQYQHRFWQYIVLMNWSYLEDFFSHTMARAGHLCHTDTFLICTAFIILFGCVVARAIWEISLGVFQFDMGNIGR